MSQFSAPALELHLTLSVFGQKFTFEPGKVGQPDLRHSSNVDFKYIDLIEKKYCGQEGHPIFLPSREK